MLNVLIAVYRAWPFRPHCNSQAGMHSFLCRAARMDGTRCPAKDA